MKKLFMLVLIYMFSNQLQAQNFYRYEFGVIVRDTVIEYATPIDTGRVWEDSSYTIPQHDFNSNFPVIQNLYNAFVGSKFVFGDLTDENILISFKLVFNKKDGLPPVYFNEKLFFVMRVEVFKMPGRIKVLTDYVFKPNQFFTFILPKSQALIDILTRLNISKDDLGFAYIRDDRFEGKDIETINTPSVVSFKARHFSKFGGGRGHITGTTGVGENTEAPLNFNLFQNYPNPFGNGINQHTPTTTISYSIGNNYKSTDNIVTANNSLLNSVTLQVYDILGRKITTLVKGNQLPGNYSVEFNAKGLPSGVYFYKLSIDGKDSKGYWIIKKMLLLN